MNQKQSIVAVLGATGYIGARLVPKLVESGQKVKDVIREHGIYGAVPWVYHRTPGFGDCNWTDVISELRLAGYEGCIDIEGWHDPVYRDELEMTGQVHGLNYLKRCRGGEYVPNPA